MFSDLILYYFLYFNTLYIIEKISTNHTSLKYPIHRTISLCTGLALISYICKEHIILFTYLIPLLIIWLFLAIKSESPTILSFVIISFGLSYFIWGLANLIVVLFSSPLRNCDKNILQSILSVFIAVLHTLMSRLFFKFNRFKNGMPFLSTTSRINVATIMSALYIIFLLFRTSVERNLYIDALSIIIVIISLAFLIYWWQAQITNSYRRSLQLRELESLRMELEENEKRIAELARQNEELGRLIHKDNKLIPAMEHAVHEYFITDFDTLDAAKEKAQSLLIEIEELSKNRHNIILEIHNAHRKHYATGIPSLDTLLNYMDKRAQQDHISLSVHLGVNLTDYVPNLISLDDLTHMLSDLLENAIIACKGKSNANIQLQFYTSEKSFIIEIADNGVPFEIESLVNFGITKLTTHSDSGGSGIGLMDIWKIKEKYFASIHITELESTAPFTKKIAFIFNKKHRYSISSKRKDLLIQASKRADLHIFE